MTESLKNFGSNRNPEEEKRWQEQLEKSRQEANRIQREAEQNRINELERIKKLYEPVPVDLSLEISQLSSLWEKRNIKIDWNEFDVPEKLPAGFTKLIYIPRGYTNAEALALCQSLFQVHQSEPMENFTSSPLDEPSVYAVRNEIESDEEGKTGWGKDYIENTQRKRFLDLQGRLILEADKFETTGEHLDLEASTQCPDSKLPNNHIATVYWNKDQNYLSIGARNPETFAWREGPREIIVIKKRV
jgi:hypothetical protein